VSKQLEVGQKAPDFCLPDTENKPRCLQEFLGQKAVLVFFIETFIEDSTKELCLFRDYVSELTNLHAQVVGITANSSQANRQLSEKRRLHFPILSDPELKIVEAYGLQEAEQQTVKQAIFVLNEEGTILHKWTSTGGQDQLPYDVIKAWVKPSVLEKQAAMVPPTVVTVSRQQGSGGNEIAQHISRMLGWTYFDKALMVEVGRSMGYSEEELVDVYEDSYKVQSFVDKLMMRRRPAALSFEAEENKHVKLTLNEEESISTIQTVITNLASRGKTVIVGRGGQAILKNKVGVLHVRVIAPKNVRLERVKADHKVNAEEAQRMIDESDKAAAEYLQRFYGINWDDPANYDLVLNMAKLDLSTAALMIAQAASQT